MAQSDAISSIDQNIDGNVQKVNTAGRDIHEDHHHYHFCSTSSTNNDDKGEQTTGSLEVRCIGLKMTGLKPWHFSMLIGGGIVLSGYFGFEVLNIVKDLVAAYGSPVVQASSGSLELLIFTKDKKSKQRLLKDLISNNILSKIKSVVGIVESDIRVEVTCIGAVIATSEDFSKLQKHLKTKQKKMQWKVEHDCKSSLIDLCCTLPMFQNNCRMIIEHVSLEDASDYLECAMQSCEFYVSQTEFLHLNKRGFLSKHQNYENFTKTQQSHPGLQNKVVQIVNSFSQGETISTKLWKINDLLAIDPRLFPGDCDWVLRNLSKISKSFAFAKEFKVAKDLLLWMIRLLDNLLRDQTISWFWFILKLAVWLKSSFMVKFVNSNELQNEISSQAKIIFKEKFFCVPGLIESRTVDCEDLIGSINFLLKQKSKSTISIATYVAEHLALDRFQLSPCHQDWYFKHVISDLVDAIHQCLDMQRGRRLKFILIKVLKNLIPENCFRNIKLNMLEISSMSYRLEHIFFYFNHRFSEIFSGTVTSLLERSQQSHQFLVQNKYFSRFCGQNCFSNLQIILFKLIYLANSQCQRPAISSVKFSEVISRAYFSKFPLQSRDANLENFYFDAIKLFKDVKVALRSESIFEVYKHGQLVIDHPRSTSRSDFVKIHDVVKMLSQYRILFEYGFILRRLHHLHFRFYELKDIFDSTSEFSKQLDKLILNVFIEMRKCATRFLKEDPPYQRLITPHKLTDITEKSDVKVIAKQFLELEFPHMMQKSIGTSKELSLTVTPSQTLQRELTSVSKKLGILRRLHHSFRI